MKEIVKWVIISDYEGTIAIFDTEKEALTSASFVGKTKIVKMIGPMPELAAKDKEIETLKAQIAAMKCCEICKHYDNNHYDAPCVVCANTTDMPKWEVNK